MRGIGDTDAITFNFINKSDDSTVLHSLLFTASPTVSGSRELHAQFIFAAPRWPDQEYRDTLNVAYTP